MSCCVSLHKHTDGRLSPVTLYIVEKIRLISIVVSSFLSWRSEDLWCCTARETLQTECSVLQPSAWGRRNTGWSSTFPASWNTMSIWLFYICASLCWQRPCSFKETVEQREDWEVTLIVAADVNSISSALSFLPQGTELLPEIKGN